MKYFNVVDSFDTHAKIPEHFEAVDAAAKESGKVGDHFLRMGSGHVFAEPGCMPMRSFPAARIILSGKGASARGHSDAIRRIEGVVDARQYTIPVEEALQSVRSGQNPDLTTRQKHTRECFVVAEEGADKARIEEEIKTMPNYFADYDTTVHFISMEELKANHSGIPHGGFVIRTGKTGWEEEYGNVIEYSLKLDSNPAFTSSVLVAYARAAYRMAKEGQKGCKTVFDIAPAYLSALDGQTLRRTML